ncbi:hypothetical protein Ndes2526B_g02035 [Nannochloris sp. 'desiccata']
MGGQMPKKSMAKKGAVAKVRLSKIINEKIITSNDLGGPVYLARIVFNLSIQSLEQAIQSSNAELLRDYAEGTAQAAAWIFKKYLQPSIDLGATSKCVLDGLSPPSKDRSRAAVKRLGPLQFKIDELRRENTPASNTAAKKLVDLMYFQHASLVRALNELAMKYNYSVRFNGDKADYEDGPVQVEIILAPFEADQEVVHMSTNLIRGQDSMDVEESSTKPTSSSNSDDAAASTVTNTTTPVVTATDLELPESLDPDLPANFKERLAELITEALKNPIVVGPDADLIAQGAPLVIKSMTYDPDTKDHVCEVVVLGAFLEQLKMPLLAFQVGGSLIANDFTPGLKGMGAGTLVQALERVFTPEKHGGLRTYVCDNNPVTLLKELKKVMAHSSFPLSNPLDVVTEEHFNNKSGAVEECLRGLLCVTSSLVTDKEPVSLQKQIRHNSGNHLHLSSPPTGITEEERDEICLINDAQRSGYATAKLASLVAHGFRNNDGADFSAPEKEIMDAVMQQVDKLPDKLDSIKFKFSGRAKLHPLLDPKNEIAAACGELARFSLQPGESFRMRIKTDSLTSVAFSVIMEILGKRDLFLLVENGTSSSSGEKEKATTSRSFIMRVTKENDGTFRLSGLVNLMKDDLGEALGVTIMVICLENGRLNLVPVKEGECVVLPPNAETGCLDEVFPRLVYTMLNASVAADNLIDLLQKKSGIPQGQEMLCPFGDYFGYDPFVEAKHEVEAVLKSHSRFYFVDELRHYFKGKMESFVVSYVNGGCREDVSELEFLDPSKFLGVTWASGKPHYKLEKSMTRKIQRFSVFACGDRVTAKNAVEAEAARQNRLSLPIVLYNEVLK